MAHHRNRDNSMPSRRDRHNLEDEYWRDPEERHMNDDTEYINATPGNYSSGSRAFGVIPRSSSNSKLTSNVATITAVGIVLIPIVVDLLFGRKSK